MNLHVNLVIPVDVSFDKEVPLNFRSHPYPYPDFR